MNSLDQINNKATGLYQEKLAEFNSNKTQISNLNYKIFTINRDIDEKRTELANRENGLEGIILRIPLVGRIIGWVTGFSAQLEQLSQEITKLSQAITSTQGEVEKLKNVDKDLNSELENLEKRPVLIMNLFGGEGAFEKLPIIDIGEREGNTGYIDFITPEDMSAPIMRGEDKHQREFFVIKVVDENGKQYCQAFFNHFKGMHWTNGSKPLMDFMDVNGYLIDDGVIKDKNAYAQLRSLIQNGQLTTNTHTYKLIR